MFAKLAAFATLALPLLAAATPVAPIVARQSATDACCLSTIPVASTAGQALLGLLGELPVAGQAAGSLIGLACTPLDLLDGGSASDCTASGGSTVSCGGGLINISIGIGCIPTQVGL